MSYNKKTWANGDLITKERMNNIENGIYTAHDELEKANRKIEENTTDTNTARQDISDIKLQIGTEELTTTSKKIKSALNEVNSQIKKKANKFEILDNTKNFYSEISSFLKNNMSNYINIEEKTYNSKTLKTKGCLDLSNKRINSNNCKLIIDENGYDSIFSNFASQSIDTTKIATITTTPNLGDNVITVNDASLFSIHDKIFLRYGDNPYDTVECKYYLLAEILNVDIVNNVLILNKPILYSEDISDITREHNKQIQTFTCISNNFKLENLELSCLNEIRVICGLDFRFLYHFLLDSITLHDINGSGIGLQFCHNGILDNINIRNITSHSDSTGRGISLAECNNIVIKNSTICNPENDAVYLEAYSEHNKLIDCNIIKMKGKDYTTAVTLTQNSSLECVNCNFYISENHPLYYGSSSDCKIILNNCKIFSTSTMPSLVSNSSCKGILELYDGNISYKYDFDNQIEIFREFDLTKDTSFTFDGLFTYIKVEFSNVTEGASHYICNGRENNIGEQYIANDTGTIEVKSAVIGQANSLKEFSEKRNLVVIKHPSETGTPNIKIKIKYAPKIQ